MNLSFDEVLILVAGRARRASWKGAVDRSTSSKLTCSVASNATSRNLLITRKAPSMEVPRPRRSRCGVEIVPTVS